MRPEPGTPRHGPQEPRPQEPRPGTPRRPRSPGRSRRPRPGVGAGPGMREGCARTSSRDSEVGPGARRRSPSRDTRQVSPAPGTLSTEPAARSWLSRSPVSDTAYPRRRASARLPFEKAARNGKRHGKDSRPRSSRGGTRVTRRTQGRNGTWSRTCASRSTREHRAIQARGPTSSSRHRLSIRRVTIRARARPSSPPPK